MTRREQQEESSSSGILSGWPELCLRVFSTGLAVTHPHLVTRLPSRKRAGPNAHVARPDKPARRLLRARAGQVKPNQPHDAQPRRATTRHVLTSPGLNRPSASTRRSKRDKLASSPRPHPTRLVVVVFFFFFP